MSARRTQMVLAGRCYESREDGAQSEIGASRRERVNPGYSVKRRDRA